MEIETVTISVLLADDHPVVRAGIRAALNAEPDVTIIGEASDGLETVRLIERSQPDVLVLDLGMPGLSGLEVLRVVARRAPKTRVVIFTMRTNETVLLEA